MEATSIGGNDYLGLARDARLADAVCEAAHKYGISPTAGRWSVGWHDLHQELEDKLAEFFGAEDACIIGSAYLGGPAFFAAMQERYRTVFCDEFAHPNLFLGMHDAGMDIRPYWHLDMEDLRLQLDAYKGDAPVVVTDGVFGIEGAIAPLGEIVREARKVGAQVFVDDCHGVFCVGENGRGAVELCGLSLDDVTLMGSMSKALGCYGGFIAGHREVVDKVRRAVNYVGSTPPPMPIVGACLAGIEIVRSEPERRQRMMENAGKMRAVLAELGLEAVSDERTPIVTIAFGDAGQAHKAAECLNRKGLAVRYFTYPTEPRDNLLRTIARENYMPEHLDRFAQALGEAIA